jgi:Rrf2 family protein
LEQVFSTLRKAGLVKSIKGPQGGYILGKDAADITIGEILRTLEGDLSVISASNDESSDKMDMCINSNVWERINSSINSAVDSINLKDLIEEYKKLNSENILMYYI